MMKSSSSSTQLSTIRMANQHYHYQHFHYSWPLLTIIGLLIIQESTFALARNSRSDLTNASNSRSTPTTTTVMFNHQDDEDMDDGIKGSQEDMYADEYDENNSGDGISTSSSQSNYNQSGSHHDDDSQHLDYDAEIDSQHEDEMDEDSNNHINSDTMSVDRFDSKRPIVDLNKKKSSEPQSTSRMSFVSSNLWRDIFSKPPILVGIIGAIVVGMLSAVLLIMFIIYRMRKKDEGSYALEEGPRKSPSHAYTRVSSKEFFA